MQFFSRLLEPFTFVLILFLAAAVWQARRRRWMAVFAGALLVLCHPLTGWLLVGALEHQYTPLTAVPGDAQAIVVLSGYDFAPDSSVRTLEAFRVHELAPTLPIFVTGGIDRSRPDEPAEGAKMRQLLLDLGVHASLVITDELAQSTRENALQAKRWLGPRGIRRIVLVTEALHVPRSLATFRTAGFDVVPSGCYFRADRPPGFPEGLLPSASAALGVQKALHEWIGLAWYRVRGYA